MFAIVATTCGLPRINDQEQANDSPGLENVAINALKAKFSAQENVVFAPFGYAAILAMLGEGARGATQQEIRQFLRLPEDNSRSRDLFRSLMQSYGGEEPETVPQFKTWFYVYENNSVNEDFVKTLRDDYLVEIKTIQRNFYEFDEAATTAFQRQVTVNDNAPEKVVLAEQQESFSDQAQVVAKESETKSVLDLQADPDNVFDEVDLEGKNLAVTADVEEILKQKECSRFDEEVDDQQYVEVQALREGNEVSAAVALEDNETVQQIEKLEEQKKIVKIDGNAETLKQLDEEMGILAEASKHPVTKKFQATGRALGEKINDLSSALSGNSLNGRKTNGNGQESKMLLFNGLYFRGKWKTPFQVSTHNIYVMYVCGLWHNSANSFAPNSVT